MDGLVAHLPSVSLYPPTLVRIEESPSALLAGMQGARLPIAVAHGEGRAEFAGDSARTAAEQQGRVAVRFVDHRGAPTTHYPENPNGSQRNIAGICDDTRRIVGMMPHPERLFEAALGGSDGLGVLKSMDGALHAAAGR